MTIRELEKTRQLGLIGTLFVSVVALAALTIPLSHARAQGFVGAQLGPFAFGVPAPYYPPGYYYPPYYYPGFYPGYYPPPYYYNYR